MMKELNYMMYLSWTSVAGSSGGVNFGQAKELAIEMALIAG